ncbi:MAG: polysaccharide deacetylase family protein [Cytophagales bacterium]|nr:polysaccharide deacetylase family protein [Cytophagales bacterium]
MPHDTPPALYLTFDDGPIPELTPWVLDILEKYQIKATFFCVGHNVQKHPAIFHEVINRGHRIGNHTHHHLKGFITSKNTYIDDINMCQQTIENEVYMNTYLFRPPYGQLPPWWVNEISAQYQIILWDVVSFDFMQTWSPQKCLSHSIKSTKPGSIIVFHDNIKAKKNITFALPAYIEHFCNMGYAFGKL